MTSYDPGDVILVPFPFTNQETTKKRPAVVVSSSALLGQVEDLIVMAITTRHREHSSFEIIIDRWRDAGLLRPSVVKPVLTTIEKALVLRKLGALHETDLPALVEGLRRILISD